MEVKKKKKKKADGGNLKAHSFTLVLLTWHLFSDSMISCSVAFLQYFSFLLGLV